MAFVFAAIHANGEIKEDAIVYHDGDVELSGWFTFDPAKPAPRPGVIVYHQWAGPSEHERLVAVELAKLGYAAFVADMYGTGIRPETQEDRRKQVTIYKSDRALMRTRAAASLRALLGQPGVDPSRVAAIGYCFGGTVAIELARSGADIRGAVSFHGGLDSPAPIDGVNIRGAILALHGADDPYVPTDDLAAFEAEMRAAKVDWQLVKYGGAVHSFTHKTAGSDNSTGAAYNEDADRRSWQAMKDFFAEIFAK